MEHVTFMAVVSKQSFNLFCKTKHCLMFVAFEAIVL